MRFRIRPARYLLIILLVVSGTGSETGSRNFNVLLITLDTTRADHLSCYNPRGVQTPHLDSLAARGVRFTHATAQVPLTLPSHACIMTGAYPPVNGLRDMGGFVLAKTHPTIASLALSAGFSTAAFVGSRAVSKRTGMANGFATFDDDMGGQSEEGKLPGLFAERRAAEVTDRTLEWLKRNGQEKFFVWVHYYDPHAPYDPPAPYKHAFQQDPYSGEIQYMDEQVGRLLDWLDKQGLTSHTLIVAIADHGESLGEHGELTHGVFLYESTLHVPFIIAGPEVPAGKVIDDQVRSIDIMPTVLAFIKLPPGAESQGVSLWPLIQQGRQVGSNYAYLETLYPRTYMGWSELRAMRTDSWKLIVAPHPELYDLLRDPNETTNLIARYPAEADQLQKKIWEITGEQAKHEKVISTPIDPVARQELESLGYVSGGTPHEIQLGIEAADPKDRTKVLKYLEQIESLLNQKAYARAVQLTEKALKDDPRNPSLFHYQAEAFEKMGNFTRAAQIYEYAIKMNCGTVQIYSRLGKAYLRLHQLDKAVAAMARASEINPKDLDNLRNLGTAYLDLERVNDAERAFEAITLQDDQYAAAYNGLAVVAIRRGDIATARRNFEKAIELDPTELEPLLNLGLLYQNIGDKERALRYFTLFLEKAPRERYLHQLPQVREAIEELRHGR